MKCSEQSNTAKVSRGGRKAWFTKTAFLYSCMLCVDLSDDIPAVDVAFETLEEWQAAR